MADENNQYPRVTEIIKVTNTAEGNGVYRLDLKIQFKDDLEPELVEFISRPSDPHGVNPQVRQWLIDNSATTIHQYVPPTEIEIRASMFPLTARQFRIGLVRGGISIAAVTAAIEAMPDSPAKDEARIEWEYATTFNRTHPLIETVATALGLTPTQVDDMWTSAANL